MRTPAVMIIGIVLAPCGLVLDLVSTVAPNWREVRNIPGAARDEVLQQGIWDICQAFDASNTLKCGQTDENYFKEQVINSAKGLMIASLIVTMAGIVVASLGIRCWEETPNLLLAGLGGILIFISGVLCIIPIAWYTSLLNTIKASGSDIRVGYCIVLGYIGSCFMVIGGGALIVCLFQLCFKKKEQLTNSHSNKYYHNNPRSPKSIIKTVDARDFTRPQQPTSLRRPIEVGDFTVPPVKPAPKKTVNITDFSMNKPCDADF
ncbi:claudin-23-like [Acipenser oxyrinchus oxyrinchus]|uniref:Claudin-23-like n=1 Tax=Acipenser oxyrinchus oxyrinchus TaxID=40147 RepID=A0AAD8GH98_ACIOX|nr:claudin-23-like [Acipenser oxyrinchus oxyrinchus]